jgi:hypothetical protein
VKVLVAYSYKLVNRELHLKIWIMKSDRVTAPVDISKEAYDDKQSRTS